MSERLDELLNQATTDPVSRHQQERRAGSRREYLRLKYKRKRSRRRIRFLVRILYWSYVCGGNLLRPPASNVDEDLFEFPLEFGVTVMQGRITGRWVELDGDGEGE